MYDPQGVAAAIKREALAWRWDDVADRCREWVAEAITGYAEEVQKLVGSLRAGARTAAAVQRSVLVLRLPAVVAIQRRLLFGSENRLWELVADEMGSEWREAQTAALSLGGEELERSCLAALRLFRLAAADIGPLLDERQLAIVERASRQAGGSFDPALGA